MPQASTGNRMRAPALAALLAAGPAAALDFSVTRQDDPLPGACVPGDCSLREAVLAANANPGPDRVLLPASALPYQLLQSGIAEDAGISGDLDVTGELEIAGAGAGQSVVAQGAADRVLHAVSSARLTLRALTLQGGRQVGQGGAVYVPGGELHLFDVVLQHNRALDRGGAVYLRSVSNTGEALQVRNTRFFDNGAAQGGAVNVAGQSGAATRASFDLVEFLDNFAVQNGGALALEGDLSAGSSVQVRRASFTENEVTATDGAGGAIANGAGAVLLRVLESAFTGNRATGNASRGGALAEVDVVERSRFSQNRATVGGALQGEDVEIVESEFCDNLAQRNGGALSVRSAYVHASTFCRNEVAGADPGDGGGAILVSDLQAALNVSRSTFDANIAAAGGAVLQRDGDFAMVQSTMAEPDAPPPGTGTLLQYEGADDGDLVKFTGNVLRGGCHFPEGAAVVDIARHNLVAPGDACGLQAAEDAFNNLVFASPADLPLQPIGANGGPTSTRPLGEEGVHPAVDHVPLAECLHGLDQRGFQRYDAGCDAGAVEQGGVPPPQTSLFADGFEDD